MAVASLKASGPLIAIYLRSFLVSMVFESVKKNYMDTSPTELEYEVLWNGSKYSSWSSKKASCSKERFYLGWDAFQTHAHHKLRFASSLSWTLWHPHQCAFKQRVKIELITSQAKGRTGLVSMYLNGARRSDHFYLMLPSAHTFLISLHDFNVVGKCIWGKRTECVSDIEHVWHNDVT